MGKIISIMNRKGGVGKTTTAVALADTLISENEAHVVVVDLDPQASASIALAGQLRVRDRALAAVDIRGMLRKSVEGSNFDLRPYIIRNVNRILHRDTIPLALLTNSEALWNLELEMAQQNRTADLQRALAERLEDLRSMYDYVIVDSPPGQSLTAEVALRTSDIIVCPTVADRLSEWGLDSFADYIGRIVNLEATPAFFVVTRYEENQTEHQDIIDALRARPRHRIALLQSAVAGREPNPLPINKNNKFVKRLGDSTPRTHAKIYGAKGSDQMIRIANAVRRELGEDAR